MHVNTSITNSQCKHLQQAFHLLKYTSTKNKKQTNYAKPLSSKYTIIVLNIKHETEIILSEQSSIQIQISTEQNTSPLVFSCMAQLSLS